jgi:hypothetical protein
LTAAVDVVLDVLDVLDVVLDTDCAVAPPEGARTTPGDFEVPHPARPKPSAAAARAANPCRLVLIGA